MNSSGFVAFTCIGALFSDVPYMKLLFSNSVSDILVSWVFINYVASVLLPGEIPIRVNRYRNYTNSYWVNRSLSRYLVARQRLTLIPISDGFRKQFFDKKLLVPRDWFIDENCFLLYFVVYMVTSYFVHSRDLDFRIVEQYYGGKHL